MCAKWGDIMRFKFLAAAGAAAMVMAGTAADAAVTFQFSGVTFRDMGGNSAGTLTGTFVTDDALAVITDFNIVASPAGSNPGLTNFPFVGYNFTTANSSIVAATLPSQFFRIDALGINAPQLQIFFNSSLTMRGTTINTTSSYENEGFSGSRLPSGSIVAVATVVPEPATWSMMMVGAALIAGSIRYHRRKSIVTFA